VLNLESRPLLGKYGLSNQFKCAGYHEYLRHMRLFLVMCAFELVTGHNGL
jgi:hypothetical protein